tara:strand:+ start:933 stop:1280 length:348 start_codon:yes stop_codon:yes gene_type:complete
MSTNYVRFKFIKFTNKNDSSGVHFFKKNPNILLDWGMLKLNSTLISEIETNIKIDFFNLIPNEYIDEFYSFAFGKKMIIVEKSYYDKFKTMKKMEYVIIDKITMNNGNQYTVISS